MNPPYHLPFQFLRTCPLVILGMVLVLACGPTVERPTGLAGQYEDAKDMFKRGKFDRATEFTDSLVSDPTPNKFTERALLLRAVIFTGFIHAYKSVADAYMKGAENTKDPHHQAEFGRQRHDSMTLGAKRSLDLGEVAQKLIQGGSIPKELTLEAPYPTTEGPIEVKELIRVTQGGWIEPEQQDAVVVDAVRKGIDDSLAEIVRGDRAKARAVLASGSAKLDGVDFSLYLGQALFDGAGFFDRKHIHDNQRYKTLLNLADNSAKAGLALLQDKADEDKEAALKKLQDQIKTAMKATA